MDEQKGKKNTMRKGIGRRKRIRGRRQEEGNKRRKKKKSKKRRGIEKPGVESQKKRGRGGRGRVGWIEGIGIKSP